jgi:hypothetical protein
MKMTARSEKWMQTVLANCEAKTGRPLAEWTRLAKKARLADAKGARAWAKEQGLSIVYQTMVVDTLFPEEHRDADDDAMVEAQYAGAKAALRPVYEAVVKAAKKLGADVEVMPRKSQVTLSRATSFAVVRAATKERVDLLLKLKGEKGTQRLVAQPKAMSSDPTHVVALRAATDVDGEVVGWMKKAYGKAAK